MPNHGAPAGFWIRLVAWTVDTVLCTLAFQVVEGRLGIEDPSPNLPPGPALAALVPAFTLNIAIACLYDTFLVGTWGATFGKMLCGVKVVRSSNGDRPTYGISLTRSLAHYFSALPLGLGYLWVALVPTKRAWHDYMCDTRVVYRRPN